MSKLVLFGLGRGADVAYRFLSQDTDHEIVAFTVDRQFMDRSEYHDRPVVAFEEVEHKYPPSAYRMCILLGYQGMNRLREQKFLEAKAKGYALESYVASNIFRVEPIRVGENCFILDNQSISLDVVFGDNIVMWSSNHLGDMSRVADHAWISSHCTIAANVNIGTRSFLGIGATVSNAVTIAPDTFVGADRLVTTNTEPGGVYVHGERDKLAADSRSFMRVMMAGKRL